MSACGATHPHLPSENFCREPAGHAGQHMAHDSQGRPEYVWTTGDVWDWAPDEPAGSPSAAVPDPADVEKAARAMWEAAHARFTSMVVTWESTGAWVQKHYRALAVAALAAVHPSPDSEAAARAMAGVERALALMGKWRAEDSFVSDPESVTRMWRDFIRDEIRTTLGTGDGWIATTETCARCAEQASTTLGTGDRDGTR